MGGWKGEKGVGALYNPGYAANDAAEIVVETPLSGI
jgi:hypothetical protein